MFGNKILIALVLVPAVFAACLSKTVPPPEERPAPVSAVSTATPGTGREAEWEKTLESARKEGKVVVVTTAGSEVRTPLSEKFKERYGLSIDWIQSSRGGELAQRLVRERGAGLYSADVYIGGSTTMLTQFKPRSILDPLPPLFLLSEVTNSSLWYGGTLPFVDKEKAYILSFLLFPWDPVFVNNQVFNPEEIGSYRDLLKPSLQSRIIMGDPTVFGAGLRFISITDDKIMGYDFHREFARQVGAIQRDERLVIDWVAQGKYPVGTGVRPDLVNEHHRAGAPLSIINLKERGWLVGSGGVLGVINNAAHPSSTKVFVNWLLGREGQLIFSKSTDQQSARADLPVDFLDPAGVRKPSVQYLYMEDEEFLLQEPENAKKAKELFSHLLR